MTVVYDFNTYLKSDTVLQELIDGDVEIFPIIAEGNVEGPFLVYTYFQGQVAAEKYFIYRDHLMYTVFDRDFDRGMKIHERIKDLLNRGDHISVGSDNYRIQWCSLVTTSQVPPFERDGFAQFSSEYEFGYVHE